MITPPRVANNTDSEINKALIAFAGLVDNEISSVNQSSSLITAGSNIDILARSCKAGGNLSYAGVADTHTLASCVLSVWYRGPQTTYARYLITIPGTTITNSFPNYPAAGSWCYLTCDYLGALRLRPATGTGQYRPTDNVYQFTGGGVGYNDIARYGYYYSDGERIIGCIYKISNTSFNYITNMSGMDEYGGLLARIYGGTVAGNPTYNRNTSNYSFINGACSCTINIELTAIGGMTGVPLIALPFPAIRQSLAFSVGFSGGITLANFNQLECAYNTVAMSLYNYTQTTGVMTNLTIAGNIAANMYLVIGGTYNVL